MAQKINYLDNFLNFAKEQTGEIFNQDIKNQIQQSIAQWLKTEDKLNKSLLRQYQLVAKENGYQIEEISSEGLKMALNRYTTILHRHVERMKTEEDITNHLKKGYELIHRIREILTGQEITYTILYTDKDANSSENLWEAHLTLEELLSSFSNLTKKANKAIETNLLKAFSLNISNSNIKNLVKKRKESLTKAVTKMDKPELWDSLVRYNNRMVDAGANKFVYNYGRVYETYSILRRVEKYQTINYIGHQKGKQNTKSLAGSILKKAAKDTIPGWQKGDIGDEQLKSVFNSSARLIPVSTIEEVLKSVQASLNKSTQEEILKELKNIFTVQEKTKLEYEIDIKFNETAIAATDRAIENANLDIK